jgi:hypothetical protein
MLVQVWYLNVLGGEETWDDTSSSGACFVSSWSGYLSSNLGVGSSVLWTTQGFVQIMY